MGKYLSLNANFQWDTEICLLIQHLNCQCSTDIKESKNIRFSWGQCYNFSVNTFNKLQQSSWVRCNLLCAFIQYLYENNWKHFFLWLMNSFTVSLWIHWEHFSWPYVFILITIVLWIQCKHFIHMSLYENTVQAFSMALWIHSQ